MYSRLHYFEPPETSEPDWHVTIYGDIVPRAQSLLAKRTPSEIKYMLSTLNYLLGPAIYELLRDNIDVKEFIIPSPGSFLRGKMSRIDIREQAAIPDGTWSEYFACLALALAGRAFEFEGIVADPHPHGVSYDPPRVDLEAETAASAMEALTIAESLIDFEPAVHTEAKKLVRLSKRDAAIKGNERRYELWDDLRKFYQSNEFKSKAAAVRQFFADLSRDDQLKLTRTPNNIKQVLKNLVPQLKDL